MSYPIPVLKPLNLVDISLSIMLGTGNFSYVQVAKSRLTNQTYAVKTYDRVALQRHKRGRDALMEKHLLGRLCHRHVVQLVATSSDVYGIYLITELCVLGELWNRCRGWGYPDTSARIFMRQIATAIEYLHRSGVVHRDIKAENIFVYDDRTVKLGDFGTGRDLLNPHIQPSETPSFKKSFRHFVGTPNFMAPEVIANENNDFVADLWSFGCTVYQVLLGIPPFVASSDYFVFLRIKALDLAFPRVGISIQAEEFIKAIVTPNRSHRLTIDAIIAHPFFNGLPEQMPTFSEPESYAMNAFANVDHVDVENISAEPLVASDSGLAQRILFCEDWKRKSKPGAGAAALAHLDFAELEDD
jgi:3-phosphoinositide dependent protein kinase-1